MPSFGLVVAGVIANQQRQYDIDDIAWQAELTISIIGNFKGRLAILVWGRMGTHEVTLGKIPRFLRGYFLATLWLLLAGIRSGQTR